MLGVRKTATFYVGGRSAGVVTKSLLGLPDVSVAEVDAVGFVEYMVEPGIHIGDGLDRLIGVVQVGVDERVVG